METTSIGWFHVSYCQVEKSNPLLKNYFAPKYKFNRRVLKVFKILLYLYLLAYYVCGRFLSVHRTWPRDEDGVLEMGTTLRVSRFYDKLIFLLCKNRLAITP